MRLTLKLFGGLVMGIMGLCSSGIFNLSAQATGPWYVSPTGDDIQDCLSPATACATLSAAIGKAGAGDTIYVASGVYTSTTGDEVLLLNKSVTLLGGWDSTFISQTAQTILDGENARRGATVLEEIEVTFQRFTFQQGVSSEGGGLYNRGSLTLTESVVEANQALCASYGIADGGGIHNTGQLWLERVIIRNNLADGQTCVPGYGGGLYNLGQAYLNNSLIIENVVTAHNSGTGSQGGGILNVGHIQIYNSTIISNATTSLSDFDCPSGWCPNGFGGGLRQIGLEASLHNTVLANNWANDRAPDCSGDLQTLGYNLVGQRQDCGFISTVGDQSNLSVDLGPTGSPLPTAFALIDKGDPAGCFDARGHLFAVDLWGAPRLQDGEHDGEARCDIGAAEYEYRAPGAPAWLKPFGSTRRATMPNSAFLYPLQVQVLDSAGVPLSGTVVLFTAPEAGPSATFAPSHTHTATALSDIWGVASAPSLTANAITGTFAITASNDGMTPTVNFLLTTLEFRGWYVSPTGSDQAPCISPATACATIAGAQERAAAEDTIYVAQGTYTSDGEEVALLYKDLTLSGGWDDGFQSQLGHSVLDGQNSGRGLTVVSGTHVRLERFTLQNGFSHTGGGLFNSGDVTLTDSLIEANQAFCLEEDGSADGGGIYNAGHLWLERTILRSNLADGGSCSGYGGGLYNLGWAYVNNSLFQGNVATTAVIRYYFYEGQGGGILNVGQLWLNNSTLIGNDAPSYIDFGCTEQLCFNTPTGLGGGLRQMGGEVSVHNTVFARNTASADGADCSGVINSEGYNALTSLAGCDFAATVGDQLNVSVAINGDGRPLSTDFILIDDGNPAGCLDTNGVPFTVDLTGAPRLQEGDGDGVAVCDIGAYEFHYTPPSAPAQLWVIAGAPQTSAPATTFTTPFRARLLDSAAIPISNTLVTFTSPLTGPSGGFAPTRTGIVTVLTDLHGFATTPNFIANAVPGAYLVLARSGEVSVGFELANVEAWYASVTGDDQADCLTPERACASLTGLLSHSVFTSPADIRLAQGVYLASGLALTDVTLSGGWDAAFHAQTGYSTLDAQHLDRVATTSGATTLERLILQNGSSQLAGGGLQNTGQLTLANSIVRDNYSDGWTIGWDDDFYSFIQTGGGGIFNTGDLMALDSLIMSNTVGWGGGGGLTNHGSLTMINTTVSHNWGEAEGFPSLINHGVADFRNVTLSRNSGGVDTFYGKLHLRHSILADNLVSDCHGKVISDGYNLIGNSVDCNLTGTQTGNLLNLDPRLRETTLNELAYFLPYPTSPVIDAGDPAGCRDQAGELLLTDQLGRARPIDGNGDGLAHCDIGAYEFDPRDWGLPPSGGEMIFPLNHLTVTLALPPNAFSETVVFYVLPTSTHPVVDGATFTLKATTLSGQPVMTFNQPYTLTIQYTEALALSDEAHWQVFYWDEAAGYWQSVDCALDIVSNQFTCLLDHLTEFALFVPRVVFLPLIQR